MLRRLGGGAVLCVLLVPLLLACAQLLHGQMLGWGERLWPGYATVRPICIEEASAPAGESPQVEIRAPQGAAAAATPVAAATQQDELLDDLLGEDPAAAAPAPATPAEAAAAVTGTTPGEAAGGGDDLLEGLDEAPVAGPAPVHPTAPGAPSGTASTTAPAVPMTAGLRTYCRAERAIAQVGDVGITWMPLTMVVLLLVSAFITTLRRRHIGLRDAENALEDRITNFAQLVAHLAVAGSAWTLLGMSDGVDRILQSVWTGGMLALAVVNVAWLVNPLPRLDPQGRSGTTIGRAFAAIPLHAWMGIIAGVWFYAVEHHPAGIAIYLQKITEYSNLYIQVGLYLWIGLMLRDTLLGTVAFDFLRPLRLPPELLAVAIVLAAAVPTAYSGASGVFVLALGATIYTELRRAGGTDELARAATAMSGSFGVVLPPCLLVVIVASLNLDVTTDELFHWGWRVFGLTALLALGIAWLTRRNPWRIAPAPNLGSALRTAVVDLLPYLAIGLVVIIAFYVFLDAGLDEHTAPYLLAVAMLAILPWDKRYRRSLTARPGADAGHLTGATRSTALDTGTQIGALLMLMGLSACLGGVIERSAVIDLFPHELGGPWPAMGLLVAAMVIIGMIMDPYGAVILVSVTLAPIAKANGIAPVHFWMMVLVGFELGYLTPPVALNQLLTRQIVQDLPEAVRAPDPPQTTFYRRHERVLLPVLIRGTTLLVVAFGPLLFGAGA